MAELLGDRDNASKYKNIATKIRTGINKFLWQPVAGYYGQYLYGRNYPVLSPRSEALGEALTVLFDIADSSKRRQIISHVPITPFGISCIYPQIPGIPPYHNDAVWPFVQSFWLFAAAKAGNEKSVMESISAIYRPAAMFLTNKENFVADNGDFQGTQINSSNMLWSLSGNISIVHKLLFGISFTTKGLAFKPSVPRAWQGERSLNHFAYRKAVLNIEMEGYGNEIAAFTVDGQRTPEAFVPDTLSGTHFIKIVLANNSFSDNTINQVENAWSLSAPTLSWSSDTIRWLPVTGAKTYSVIKNGEIVQTITASSIPVRASGYAEYQVIAKSASGLESFASEPLAVVSPEVVQTYEIENYATKSAKSYKGYYGDGFVEINKELNTTITIPIQIKETGLYIIDLRYTNGNGPINTENKCAIRSLDVNGKLSGTFVLPQRGRDEWSNWGYSNSVKLRLAKGSNSLTIRFSDYNDNMNGEINQAMLDQLRIIRLNNK
jgi:hypothetical protein